MSKYTVKFEINWIPANNPRAAAEEILSWLRQGDFNGTWDVTDQGSGETVLVDLDEPEEDDDIPDSIIGLDGIQRYLQEDGTYQEEVEGDED